MTGQFSQRISTLDTKFNFKMVGHKRSIQLNVRKLKVNSLWKSLFSEFSKAKTSQIEHKGSKPTFKAQFKELINNREFYEKYVGLDIPED